MKYAYLTLSSRTCYFATCRLDEPQRTRIRNSFETFHRLLMDDRDEEASRIFGSEHERVATALILEIRAFEKLWGEKCGAKPEDVIVQGQPGQLGVGSPNGHVYPERMTPQARWVCSALVALLQALGATDLHSTYID